MRYSIPIVVGVVLVVGFILFAAYYFMLWPFQPSLEVDDPVVAEWLQQDGIVIYRRGEELANSRTISWKYSPFSVSTGAVS